MDNVISIFIFFGFLLSFAAIVAVMYGIYYGIIVYVGYRIFKYFYESFKKSLT